MHRKILKYGDNKNVKKKLMKNVKIQLLTTYYSFKRLKNVTKFKKINYKFKNKRNIQSKKKRKTQKYIYRQNNNNINN